MQHIQLKRNNIIILEDVASRGIGIETACLTLESTYQEYIRELKYLSSSLNTAHPH